MPIGSKVWCPLDLEFWGSGLDVQGPRFKGFRPEGQRSGAQVSKCLVVEGSRPTILRFKGLRLRFRGSNVSGLRILNSIFLCLILGGPKVRSVFKGLEVWYPLDLKPLARGSNGLMLEV